MKKMHAFRYEPEKKQFYFDNNEDYQWAKAMMTSLSVWHHLDEKPIGPFRLFCSDEKHSLIARGLTATDEARIIALFESSKITKLDLEKSSKYSLPGGSYVSGLFFSSKKTCVAPNDEKKLVHTDRKSLK